MKDAPKSRRGAFAYNPSRNETAESRKKILKKKKKSRRNKRLHYTHVYIYCGAKKKTPSRECCFLFTWLTCMKLGHVICWGLAVFFFLPFIPFIFYRDLTAKVSHKQRVYIYNTHSYVNHGRRSTATITF
jgi:hypothetical protein